MNEKHLQKKRLFKILGSSILSIGIILTIIAFINFFITFNSGEGIPKLFFLAFIGMPLIAIGGILISFGYRKEITTYIKNESIPVANDALNELKPGISSASEALSKKRTITCPVCKAINDIDATYCKKCGTKLKKICPTCGYENDLDSEYCAKCGIKL